MVSDSQKKAVKKYQETKDRIVFYAPLGSKDQLNDIARQKGFESLNQYILYLLQQDIEREHIDGILNPLDEK